MNLINKIKFLLKKPKVVIVTGEGRACAKEAIYQVLKQYFKIGSEILVFETNLTNSALAEKFKFLITKSSLPILVVTQVGDIPFDKDFFAYKEDVDLAWRLKLAGYQSVYNPSARAYHRRAVARKTDLSDKGTITNRWGKTALANYLSYRNHLWMLIKNEGYLRIFFHPVIWWYELKKIIYLLFKEPNTRKALPEIVKQIPKMSQKRKRIKQIKSIKNQDLKKWFK